MPCVASKMSRDFKFAAVLPAGGLGKRMGSKLPKQLLPLGGKPVYRHSLETFAKIPSISEVVLAVPADWKSRFEEELRDFPKKEKLKIVVGGEERWLSVKNGIEALSAEVDAALVHDVARPLVSAELILQVMQTVEEKGACIVAKPSVDTVKLVEGDCVLRTIPRETVYLAQTPQAAEVSLFKELYKRLAEEPPDFLPTDEASIFEHYGIPVHIVPGNSRNDKLTTPADLEVMAALTENA